MYAFIGPEYQQGVNINERQLTMTPDSDIGKLHRHAISIIERRVVCEVFRTCCKDILFNLNVGYRTKVASTTTCNNNHRALLFQSILHVFGINLKENT